MKIKKSHLNEVNSILDSFSYFPKKTLTESKKIPLPKHIVTYIEKKLNNEDIQKAVFKGFGATYTLEEINDLFYLTREIDGTKKVLLLLTSDLLEIKDTDKITKADVKNIVNKVDRAERRFGL